MQDPWLFSLSMGIREEDLDQLNIVTTHRDTRTALPSTTGDPWHYYGPDGWTSLRGDSSTEAMDTDGGQHTSRTLTGTAHRMAAEARGDTTTAYAELADPMPMFATSDAAITDLLPSEKPELQCPDEEWSRAASEETFVPFDFKEAFISHHGIIPKEADVPSRRGGRITPTTRGGVQ